MARAKALKVRRLAGEDGVDEVVVQAGVLVHEEVAEAGHLDQLRGQYRRDDAFLAEDDEDVGAVGRGAKAVGGDEVVPDVRQA